MALRVPGVEELVVVPDAGARATRSTSVIARREGRHTERGDDLAVEEPLEVHIAGPGQRPMSVGVTMRTPGHDFELAVGLVCTDGIVAPTDIVAVHHCVDEGTRAQRCNIVTVDVAVPVTAERLTRQSTATAACGLCGKAALKDLEVRCDPVPDGPVVDADLLPLLPRLLRSAQRVFERTGGLHATGVFDTDGRLLVLREDIGRHNALDKVIGEALLSGTLPVAGGSRDRVVLVSGRLGFELVQKLAVGGYPIVAAVSAPSSLAVEAAERFGITVVGFLRGADFNVYSRPDRLALGPS
jgi:FdhD protein